MGQDPAPPFLVTVSGFAGPSWSLNGGGAPRAQSQASFHKFFMGSPEDLVPALLAVRLGDGCKPAPWSRCPGQTWSRIGSLGPGLPSPQPVPWAR